MATSAHNDYKIFKTPYSWFSRRERYKEVETYSFAKYTETFIKKAYVKTGKVASLKALFKQDNLYALKDFLIHSDKIRVIHTTNDFLLSSYALTWLKTTLQDKLTLFDAGGHLGEFYRPEAQKALIDNLK